ncbi:MAG: hypothetical protein Q8O99_07335 [bacterium]|nr:hypothetical protein [bacterium]
MVPSGATVAFQVIEERVIRRAGQLENCWLLKSKFVPSASVTVIPEIVIAGVGSLSLIVPVHGFPAIVALDGLLSQTVKYSLSSSSISSSVVGIVIVAPVFHPVKVIVP